MLKAYVAENGRLHPVGSLTENSGSVIWADLLVPAREEEQAIEEWLGVGIPTREEMEEIEISSRLYVEDGVYFMTAILPAHTDDDEPEIAPVTFILAANRLVTIRYHEPRAFQIFPTRAEKAAIGCASADTVLIGLLDTIVDRLADVLERISREIEILSKETFSPTETNMSKRDARFQSHLKQIGKKESLTSKIRDSLASLQRLSGFLANLGNQTKAGKETRARIKTLSRDITSLTDHTSFLSQKILFLLDATLGMINIEQSAIIKIVSVAAVVFLPPTVVASIYGMNFRLMPELDWALGYPFALAVMLLAAIIPFWYFRWRGWL